jgi:orotate phosphoribosyltransferase
MSDDLAARIHDRALLTGHFTLRSGATSDVYFDKYRFEADPALLREIAEGLAPLIPEGTEVLAGLELGGVPIATVLSQVTGIPTLFVRKEAKSYGTAKLAEGGPVEGRSIVVVEDVVTSGGQVLLSAADLRGLGATISRVVCVIDREAGGREKLAADDLQLHALFTRTQLEAAAAGG